MFFLTNLIIFLLLMSYVIILLYKLFKIAYNLQNFNLHIICVNTIFIIILIFIKINLLRNFGNLGNYYNSYNCKYTFQQNNAWLFY